MEFVIVTYPGGRPVNIDDAPAGSTNEVLELDAGTHKFDLGLPADYDPSSQEVAVEGTNALAPLKIAFRKKGG